MPVVVMPVWVISVVVMPLMGSPRDTEPGMLVSQRPDLPGLCCGVGFGNRRNRHWVQGQLEIESRPDALQALHPGSSAMGLCDRRHDGQAEPCPLTRAGQVRLKEPVEDVLGFFWSQSRPLVGHAQRHRCAFCDYLDLDGA